MVRSDYGPAARVTPGGLSSRGTPKRRSAGARTPYRESGFGVFFFLFAGARERVSALGVQLDAPLGRQRVRGALSVNSVGYRPHPRITLSLGLRRETRSTSLAFGAYAINVASLGAHIGF